MSIDVSNFITSLLAGTGANLTSEVTAIIIKKLFNLKPKLKQNFTNSSCPEEFQKTFNELIAGLQVLAGTGEISINQAVISSLSGARFDHQEGKIYIGGTQVIAPTIQSGGTDRGQTTVGENTELRSSGTSIKTGYGASIVISGNAKIVQN